MLMNIFGNGLKSSKIDAGANSVDIISHARYPSADYELMETTLAAKQFL